MYLPRVTKGGEEGRACQGRYERSVHLVDPSFERDRLEDGHESVEAVVVAHGAVARIHLVVRAHLAARAVLVVPLIANVRVVDEFARAGLGAPVVELAGEEGHPDDPKKE